MNLKIGNLKEAAEWLTDGDWLAFNFEGDFCQFLEDNYFEPGTPKNSEFETLILPTEGGLSFWFRIRDTEENRESLKKALIAFYGSLRPDFEEALEAVQKEVENFARERIK